MNNLSGNPPRNLSAGAEPAESEAARVVARVRVIMIISVLTTALAVAAVVTVIGYRFFTAASSIGTITDGTVMLPKGSRLISTGVSAGRIVVTLDVGGASEIRIFDIKTFKQIGRLRFATEP
jgi:hypothetical protein